MKTSIQVARSQSNYEMHSCLRRKGAVLLLIAITALTASKAETFRSPKPRSISFRIVAIAEPVGRSSLSPNRDALLVSMIDEANRAVPAKVVFRYMGYEDSLPPGLVDYDLAHVQGRQGPIL